MNKPSVTIIIPTFKRNSALFRLLRSINIHTKPTEIILVIQGEVKFNIPGEFRKLPVRVLYLDPPDMAKARNLGARYSKGNLLLFLDDDVLVTNDLIMHHQVNFNDTGLASTVGRVLTAGQSIDKYNIKVGRLDWLGNISTGYSSTIKQNVDSVIGCNMCWRKDIYLALKGIDEQYTGNALREETDLSIRARRKYRILFVPEAKVIHTRFKTGGARKTEGRMQWYYHFFSNETYFFLKHRQKILLPIYLGQRFEWALRCMFGFGREVSLRSMITPLTGIVDGFRKYHLLKTKYAYWR